MKSVTWLLFLSVVVLPVSAQSIFLTPRAGLNWATITQANGTFKPGLNFGVSGEYFPTPQSQLATVVGLYYSMQGTDLKDRDVNPDHNYLNLPVLLKYYLKAVGEEEEYRSGLSFFAGPQLDLKAVGNKVSYEKGAYSGVLLSDDMTRLFGLSAVVGLEYLFEMGLVLSANVNVGLTNKAKDPFLNYGEPVDSEGSYRDLVVQINFGYRFSIF